MRHLGRACFSNTGYVFATRAEEIARKHGIKRIARLASNENPFPPSQKALECAEKALREVNRYPPEVHRSLLRALTEHFGYQPVVLGNGMDGVIETVLRTLVDPGERVVITQPTFSFYGIAATAQSASLVAVPRKTDFSVDVPAFIQACQEAKLAFLCTPNNPTGTFTPVKEVRKILDATETILFLDNAYIEFAAAEYLDLMQEYDHLIIGRTMSKAYSLAGLRLGYAFVPEWFEMPYMRASTPFAVNSVTAAAAEGALSDSDHVARIVTHVQRWRKRFLEECGVRAYPSEANFILLDVAPRKGDEVMEHLAARGVMVRSCTSFPGIGDHFIRVSIGEAWENELFLREIAAL